MHRRTVAAVALAGLFSLALAAPAGAVVVHINSNVAANTSWGPPASGATVTADVFVIDNTIAVNSGFTLTLLPRTIVKMASGITLSVNGSLQTQGTAIDSVIITSIKDDGPGGDTNGDGSATSPNISDWAGISINSTASPDSSRLKYTDVRFAGSGSRAAVLFNNATSGRMTNCLIRRSYFGVDCSGTAAPLLVDTYVMGTSQTPLILDFTANPTLSNFGFAATTNAYDAYMLRPGTLSTAVTLPKRPGIVGVTPLTNITYVLQSTETIAASGNLTINPGVVIKPLNGGFSVSGNLTMNGTPTDTITITSINDDNFGQPLDTNNNGSITAPNRGDWGNLALASGSTGSVQYCRLKFGTNSVSSGILDVTSLPLSVSNTLLSDGGHGIAIHGATNPTLTNVAINNCSSTPTLMSVSANPTFTNVTFTANSLTALGLIGEAVSVDAHLIQRTVAGFANITYDIMNGTLNMQNGFTLTVDAGVVVKVQGQSINIDGALVADGTAGQIVFTSEKDDQFGNPPDTNGDGSITTPAQGNWGYIRFNALSNNATCRLINCRLAYGSGAPFDGYPTNLWITSSAPQITNCTITKGYYGIRIDGNATPTISGCTITNCGSAPLLMSVQSDPTLTSNTYQTNGLNGIALLSETLSQNSLIKYRPTVTFPGSSTVFAYITTGTITVPSGVTLAVQPQVVIKPSAGGAIFDVFGALNVVGNASPNRVIITSIKDDSYDGDTNNDGSASSAASGDWGQIKFEDTSVDAACVLRNVLFQFGGSGGNANGAVMTVSASPRLVRLEFFSNRTAFTFTGNSQPVLDTVTVLNCSQIPIVASLVSNPSYSNMTFSNNSYTALGILGETVAQDVRTPVRVLGTGILNNIAYMLAGTVDIAFGAKWTIDPGIVIKLGRIFSDPAGNLIQIDGALVANGKPDSLIVFTSSADDAFGGDTFGDGALTSPAPQQWQEIDFSSTVNTGVTVINNCLFRYGGYSGRVMQFTNTSPTITNCTFTSNYEGIDILGISAPTFTNVNIDSSQALPVRMSLVSNPTFNNVQFKGNYYTGLGIVNETIAQDLLWKIRSVSGRQNMPYMIDGQLGIGLGTSVTVQPGVMVKFIAGGSIDVNRAFVAEGRTVPESLIVFTSSRDDFYGGRSDSSASTTPAARGNWNGIYIEGTAIDPQVRFRNCVFRYGNLALRAINSSPSVDSCIFAVNNTGISVEGASNPTVHGSSLYGNFNFAINNPGASFCVNATGNWWGAASGPNDANGAADVCGAGTTNAGAGDVVSNNVNYSGFTTSGILNPLLGDVSLNGQVLAYDASLILQYLVPSISLSNLQKLVADVDNTGGITAIDASYILQLVVGNILALPGNKTHIGQAPPDLLAARAVMERAHGAFDVVAGEPRQENGEWLLPVRVTGDAPIWAVELRLVGGAAAALANVTVTDGAMFAFGTPDGAASVVVASGTPMTPGDVVTLHFPVDGNAKWTPPALAWSRVNYQEKTYGPPVASVPQLSFLAQAFPNPAHGPVSVALGVSARDDGARARVVVLDLAGRRVRTLQDGPLAAGQHTITWNLTDASGRPVAAGVYLLRGEAGRFSAVRRLVVVR